MRAGCRKFAMVLCPMLLLGGAIPVLSHAVTPVEQAFIDGQATAQSATPNASTNITNGTIATTVNSFNPSYYNYSSSAPEEGYFMGGNGDTTTPGAGKVTACQTGPVNPNAFLQQNCEAINYMSKNPTTRPQFTITPGDPNVTRSRIIEANPGTLAASSLGYANPSAIGAFTGCTSRTVTTPPTYTTEACNEYLNATSQMCIVGRTIVVDAKANYQCNQTANAYQTQTCNKTLNVVVTPTPYCSVSGRATGLGSYENTTTKRVYSSVLRKWVYTTTTSTISYPHFDVTFGCSGDALAKVAVTISAGSQCHGGGCNSDYYPITLNFIPGTNAGPVSLNMARTYDGIWWETSTVSYNGASNTVTITTRVSRGRGGFVTATARAVPSGTVGIRNVITSSWVNGCATQQAAAL